MAEDSIDVRIRYLQEGAQAVDATLKNLTKQFNNLSRINASMAMSTGRAIPNFSQQAVALSQLGGAAQGAARDIVALKQQGSVFSQIFTGRSSQNIQSLLNQYGGTMTAMSALGGKTSWLSSRMSEELGRVKVVSDTTTGSLRNLTDVEKFRIMGHVVGQEMANTTQAMLNAGKNMQWVGRQMTVGLTLPILLGAKSMTMSFLTLNNAQTEFQKYMIQNGATTEQALAAFDTSKLGNLASLFEDIAVKTGLYTDEVTNLGAAWVAAGYDVETAVPQFTALTAQLSLLAQGEIDQAQSIELIRSVQKSWGLDTEETIDQIKKLNLVAGTTSLTLGEVADSLPLASSAASLLGISASQLGALFAGMREKGVSASQAANTLKFSVNRIVNPTEKANETFQQFFKTQKDITDLFFGQNGQPKGLEGFKQLADMFGRLNEEQQGQLAGQLFGGYRFDRMLKLMASIREEGSQFNVAEDIAQNSEAAANAAAEAWQNQIDVIQSSAAQAFKVMKVEFIAIAQKIGAIIWPYVNKIGQGIIKMLDAFTRAPDFVKNFIVAMGAVLAAIGPVVFIMGQLTEAAAILKKALIVFPFEKFFGMSNIADPYGLTKLATETKNPLLQLMAGVPLAEEQIAQFASVTDASLAKTTAALEGMGIAIDKNTASALAMNSALQGEGLPPLETRLPFYGQGADALLNGTNGLQIKRYEDLAQELQDQIPGLTQSSAGFQGPIPIAGTLGTTTPGHGFIAEEMVAQSMGLSLDDFRAVKSGEKSLLQVIGTGQWAVANADDLARLSKMAPEVQAGVVTAMSAGGLGLSEALEKTLTKEVGVGIAGAEAAAKQQSMGFFQKLKALFTGQSLTVLGAGTGGAEAGGLFQLIFGSPAAILAIGAAVAVIVKNWQSIWRGLKPAIQTLGKLWGDFVKKIISGFEDFADGTSSTESIAHAFEFLGKVIGDVAIEVSKLVQGLIAAVAFFAGNAISGIEQVFAGLINVFRTLTGQAGAFGDLLNNLGAILNPFNEKLSTTARIIAILTAAWVAFKAKALVASIWEALGVQIANIAGAFTTLSGTVSATVETVGVARAAMVGFGLSMAEVGTVISAAMPLVTALALAGVALVSMFHHADESAKGFAATAGEVSDAMQDLINSVKEGDDITSALDTSLSALKDRGKQVADSFSGLDLGTTGIVSDIDAAKARLAELYSQLGEGGHYGPGLRDEIEGLEGQLAMAEQFMGQVNQNTQEWIAGLRLAHLSLDEVQKTAAGLKGEIKSVQDQLSYTTDEGTRHQLESYLAFLRGELDGLNSGGIRQKAILDSVAAGYDKIASSAANAANQQRRSQEYVDALANQMSQLANAVQDAFMSQFDAQAQAQTDALAEAQQAAMDALTEAQDRQMEHFDRTAQHRMDAFEKDADAQVNAIDRKIEAIQKQSDKEDWAQQQAEYRRERERLIQQQEMSEAMAFAERMKAIHEGRYDDARIIQLQQLEDSTDFNNQLNDLDKKHTDDVRSHRQDKRVAELEKQKELLQKQLDKQREALQKQIDNQREALQKQFDLEKKALQKRQDLQQKMLQESLDNERDFLNNMFSELNEQMPKNKKEWGKYWDDVKKLAKSEGVNVNGILKQYANDWHQSIKQGLNDAVGDAAREASAVGAATGAGLINGYNQKKKAAITPEDKALIQNLQNFLRNMSSTQAAQMSPQQLRRWLDTLNQSLLASIKSSGSNANATNFIGRQIRDNFHTGGHVDGKHASDIPATLQQGEFVMKRDAVKKYGKDFMDKINSKKFHSGGYMDHHAKKYHSGGIVTDAVTQGLFDTQAKAMTDLSTLGATQQITRGFFQGAIQAAGQATKAMIRGVIEAKQQARQASSGGSYKANYDYPEPPVSAGNVKPLTYSNQTWPVPSGVPSGGARASTIGTAPVRNYYARLKNAFAGWDISNAGIYNRRNIAGTSTWSQHAWGNAIDIVIGSTTNVLNSELAQAKMDMMAGWTAANHNALRVATQLWRANADHMNHMHVDFWPQGTGTPPVLHDGGIYMGNNKFKGLGNLRFQGPAILQAGETVLPTNVTKALNSIGSGGVGADVEKNIININVEIKGDMYGDDQSYQKLYNTLERAGSQIARNRGVGHNSVVRVGVN